MTSNDLNILQSTVVTTFFPFVSSQIFVTLIVAIVAQDGDSGILVYHSPDQDSFRDDSGSSGSLLSAFSGDSSSGYSSGGSTGDESSEGRSAGGFSAGSASLETSSGGSFGGSSGGSYGESSGGSFGESSGGSFGGSSGGGFGRSFGGNFGTSSGGESVSVSQGETRVIDLVGGNSGGSNVLYKPVVRAGPPIISKHFYVHEAPDDASDFRVEEKDIIVRPQKHYKIVFVKVGSSGGGARINNFAAFPQNEEKTIVYILKKEEESSFESADLPEPPPPIVNQPEVYFVKYKSQEEGEKIVSKVQGRFKEN